MFKQKYIQIITILGLVLIFLLQCIWLCNTYLFVKEEVKKECTDLFNQVLYKEANIVSKNVPEGTVIGGGTPNDSISIITYIYDGISKLGYQYSLSEIDSLTHLYLNKKNIKSEFVVCILDSCKILQKSKMITIPQIGIVKTEIIPLKIDNSIGMQLVLTNPYWNIFNKMWIIYITTIIITALTIICITYQIKYIFKLNKISQIREDFSYAMVHDMKTPLSSILSALNFLQGGRLDNKPEMKEKFFNIAKDEADHLLTLTNKILTISKLENNKLEMNCEIVMLESLLVKLSEKFKAKSPKPVTFKFDLKAESIYADAEYIEEVFCNMIDNSIKYSKDSVDIKISSSENSKYSIIKIFDNGLGMNDDDQLKIFNKYERAYDGRRKKMHAAGFGLGLNFVQQVIEAHKGKIIVNSVEGEFTEFIIYLPLILKEL